MMSWKKMNLALALAAGAVLSVSPTASANLLANPGFEIEDAGGPSSNADAWVEFAGGGASAGRDGVMPRTGNWDQAMQGTGTGGWAGAFQSVTTTPGEEYTFSVWAKVDDMGDGTPGVIDNGVNSDARFRIEWRDSGGSEISRDQVNITASLTGTYQYFDIVASAPAGAVEARPVLALNKNGDIFYFDDASFAVPEPASFALLSLGGLAMLRRR